MYLFQKTVRWKKRHIISFFLFCHHCNISGKSLICTLSPSCITGTYIRSNKKKFIFLRKRTMCIHCIIIFLNTKQLFIVMNRKQCCRKENRTVSLFQIILKIHRRIDTKKLDLKPSVFHHFRKDHIIFIHDIMDI